MHPVTIACDIDGVLAPISLEPDLTTIIELPRVNHGTHVLLAGIRALKMWHHLGAVVSWHSTWRPPYTDDLARTVYLPDFPVFATEDEFLCPEPDERAWWKLSAIKRWLRDHPDAQTAQLIWIDDDIDDAIREGEISPELLDDPRLKIISPTPDTGLTAENITTVTELIEHGLVV